MSATILLGSNGLIGRKLLPLLRATDVAVKTAGRQASADIHFDWDDPKTFEPALACAKLLYLVPPAMVAHPAPQVERLLKTAKAVGVKRVVAVSSLGVTFPTEPPHSGRRRYEEAIITSGIDWAILRPSGFMQNFSEGFMLPAIRHAGVIASATGDGQVSMIDSSDIAAIAVELLRREDLTGRTIEVTGPEAKSFAEMAAIISASAGRVIAYQPVDEHQMEQMMLGAAVPAEYAAMLLRDQRAIRDGDATSVTTTFSEITGREPIAFEEFARLNAAAWH